MNTIERIIKLCGAYGCSSVKVTKDKVELGEEGNKCTLNKEEWNTLVELIQQRRIDKI